MAENVLDRLRKEKSPPDGWMPPAVIDQDEWTRSRPAPDCIVSGLLYADVGVQVAPGGTGKTTLNLFVAIHIALGRPVFGLDVRRAGPVLILTAEDTREMLVARMREICADLGLSETDLDTVRRLVRLSDVSAAPTKLTAVFDDVVRPNHVVDEIIDGCRENPPVLIVIDPAVSFGVGESRVNDAEQGLIEAARKIRSALGCCVLYVHHSGKASGRDRILDQYAGRGGSAFADGSRMVLVLASFSSGDAGEWEKLVGCPLTDGETGIILARPKLSYAPPQPPIYIVRRGYHFQAVTPIMKDGRTEVEGLVDQVFLFLAEEFRAGRHHSAKSLEIYAKSIGITRAEMRDVVTLLKERGRAEIRAHAPGKRGGMTQYLHPIFSPGADGEAFGEAIIGGAL